MRKKIFLALITFAMAMVAYFALSSADYRGRPTGGNNATDAVRNFVSLPTSRSAQSISDAGVTLSPGDHTMARVYDDVSGRLKYQFEAKTWEPVNDTDFALQEVLIQLFSPKGEITYISADTAHVTLARKGKNRLEPKRGWLKGNVKVVIDRTTTEWREANPQRAERDAHPDELIDIDLNEAQFDLDQAELITDGAIVVDSREARMEEVKGLRVQWNQMDNRIDVLHFQHGGRMMLRRGGKIVDFGMPGSVRDAKSPTETNGELALAKSGQSNGRSSESAALPIPRAQAMKPMAMQAITAEEAASQVRTEGGLVAANRPKSLKPLPGETEASDQGGGALRSLEALAADVEALKSEARGAANRPTKVTPPAPEESKPKAQAFGSKLEQARKRVQAYSAVFHNKVMVEQKSGQRTIGKLSADKLEVNFDFGRKLKDMTRVQNKEPASKPAVPAEPVPSPETASEQDETTLVLTWDGPLEMRPLPVDPSEQTGQRFDAIATGNPVDVESEQGSARCKQLVYRHERGQVWLSGTDQEPASMAVNASRRLVAKEVFFDQKRGLARVDGAGYMLDERRDATAMKPDELKARASELLAGNAEALRKKDRSVEIRWSRAVDIELGRHTIKRKNPKTGLLEEKGKEYLQRAWFHGNAFVRQGEARLSGDEIAVTFGPPQSSEEVADHIQHLDMAGRVKLAREEDFISADQLEVEMILTPEGRNVPRIVKGGGQVFVRQNKSEFRAERLKAVLQTMPEDDKQPSQGETTAFGGSRLGIETLEAYGKVQVSDPEHNLRIRQAETLTCTMHVGNRLSKATIVSKNPETLARLRFEEMAIHGHRIEIDMDAQAVDVPGPGKAWMVSHKDFGGRPLKKPAPVKTTWSEKMQFRLAKNYGLFIGQVRSESQAFALNCDKLTVRFAKAPPVREEEEGKPVDRFWLLGAITKDKAEMKPVAVMAPGQERSRPASIVAEGHAEALSSSYAPNNSDGTPGRLLSRLCIVGDRIVADLLREQMSVPGTGSLLIEDYQLDRKDSPVRLTSAGLPSEPLMSSMRSEGPSQTMVSWKSSMDFFLDRNLIAFDRDVRMDHRSGQEIVLQDDLAKAMQVSIESLRKIRSGRKASLTCGYLLLEFEAREKARSGKDGESPLVRATDLRRMIAKSEVHLQDGTKSLMGAHLQYLQDTNEVRLEGSPSIEARIIDQEEGSQRFNMWRGPLLIWNRQSNRIEAPGATIRAGRAS